MVSMATKVSTVVQICHVYLDISTSYGLWAYYNVTRFCLVSELKCYHAMVFLLSAGNIAIAHHVNPLLFVLFVLSPNYTVMELSENAYTFLQTCWAWRAK